MKKIIVFLAEGFEEIEALAPVDVLRRAGFTVDMASVEGDELVCGARKIVVKADIALKDADISSYDGCILPGGFPGYENLKKSSFVKDAVLSMHSEGKLVSAICAAPTVLAGYGILEGKNACCYPGMEEELSGAKVTFDSVTVDGNIITSRGAGTALDFSYDILEYFTSKETAEKMATTMVAVKNITKS